MKKTDDSAIDNLLVKVQKPGRYSGGELNSVIKKDADVRIAVSYPDLYEVAMSNSGIKILYDVVNRIDNAACERVFAVDLDMEEALRNSAIPLFTLETRTPLADLDMVGFNLSHELLITNVLQILDLGGIPILAKDRNDSMPIIAAGGGAVSNPAPYAGFFDLFFIGDGEDGIVSITETLLKAKNEGLSRDLILRKAADIESVYVPRVHGEPELMPAESVKRRRFRSSTPSDPLKPLVSGVRAAQDRAVIEITRGCPNLCKFCHSGYYDLPYRKYDIDKIAERIKQIVQNTGYDEVTFSSLSVSDYPGISSLLDLVLPWLTERGISVSLPSLRVDPSTLPLVQQVSDLRSVSLTFAVESASQELREIAHKKVYDDELLSMTKLLFSRGWRLLKFYFMLGLPGCEEIDEAEATIVLLKKVLNTAGRGVELNVTLSPFVPKPHTPFQREKMMSAEYFFDTVLRIKRGLPRQVRIKSHDIWASVTEGVLSRGDSALTPAIIKAFRSGARLDSWSEHFNRQIWDEAFSEIPGGSARYLEKNDNPDLPWSFVATGYEKLTEKMTRRSLNLKESFPEKDEKHEVDTQPLEKAVEIFKHRYTVKSRVLMKFTKTGRSRFISHLDYVEVLKRAMRMAELPLAFSQGFNKRERLLTGNPIPLGVESVSELVAIDLFEDLPLNFEAKLNDSLPEGISLSGVFPAAVKFNPSGSVKGICYELFLQDDDRQRAIRRAEESITFTSHNKKGDLFEIPFDEAVTEFCSDDENIILTLNQAGPKNIKIDRLVHQLAAPEEGEPFFYRLLKKGQYIEGGFY